MKRTTLNRKGQMTLELVLMMIALLAFTVFIGNQMKSNNYVQQLVSGPWDRLAGMLQNGQWAPPEDSQASHPNVFARHISLRGEEP